MSLKHKKIAITLPEGLLKRLNQTVPSHQRSLFIAEAIEKHLELLEQCSALEETAGMWTLENHPTLQNDEEIDKWLRDSRQGWG